VAIGNTILTKLTFQKVSGIKLYAGTIGDHFHSYFSIRKDRTTLTGQNEIMIITAL
jgi:hypothetical protein